jgi:hypothetical protein
VVGYSGWRLLDGPTPQRGGGIAGSMNEARWSYAPTGRKGIAQGKAKRRPGIGVPETTQALKGRNRRPVNQCAHVSPFQGFGELGRRRTQRDGVRPRVALRSTLGYLIKPRWGGRSGYGSVLSAYCRRCRLWWVIRDGVCPMVLCPNGRRDRGFIERSSMVLCPNGAQGDSPGQSEAPPWDRCARNNPSPERAEPAARKSMRTCFALSGLWRIGAAAYPGRWRTTQGGASLYPGLSH